MDDYQGQQPVPVTPPPPTYSPQAQTPTTYPVQAPSPAGPPPAKKKTWLWILIAVVVVGLLGCCAFAVFGLALFSSAGPEASIDAINQAALDGDVAAFEKYFDAESVTRAAYEDVLDVVRESEDYASIVADLGEEEADRILREDALPEDEFVEEMSAEFNVEDLDAGEVPFPEYTVKSTSVENAEAELTIVTLEEGEEVTYVLGLTKEMYDGEEVWRLKEIRNIADLLDEAGAVE